MLDELHKLNIKYAIVSSSPKGYIERALKYHKLNFNYIVGQHDVSTLKASSEGLERCFSHFNLNRVCDSKRKGYF